MSRLQVTHLALQNFRGFAALDVSFEPDLTVLFAENGGGKTALLTGLAMALALLQPRRSKERSLDVERDVRQVRGASGLREPTGACRIACAAAIGDRAEVGWSVTASATSSRQTAHVNLASDAIEAVRLPGERWPLLAFYDTGRFASERKAGTRAREFQDRWDGYAGCLDPCPTDRSLLDWLKAQVLGDLVRHRKGEPERRLDAGVLQAIERATPGVKEIWYDPASEGPVVRFDDGTEATWDELSDGFHIFMALVGDIARRAVILNGQDGAEAPLHIEGVVIVDEIDLHLHPRWQRIVLDGLRRAFPKVQFIVTTHSPQVLSSVENRQARRLVNWAISDEPVFVEGRDSNAILREEMGTDDRDDRGTALLRALHDLIDDGRVAEARALLEKARAEKWGPNDPTAIRAEGLLDEAASEPGRR